MLGQGGFELMTFRSPDKNAVPEPNLKGSPRKNNCIFQLSKGKHFPPSLIEGDSCPLGFAACFAWREHSFLNLYGLTLFANTTFLLYLSLLFTSQASCLPPCSFLVRTSSIEKNSLLLNVPDSRRAFPFRGQRRNKEDLTNPDQTGR